MSCGPYVQEVVDETAVEVCMELARMYDTEDLAHPPFWSELAEDKDDNKDEEEK